MTFRYHRGSSGVVLRVGSAVRNWKPGDKVVVHCNYVDDQDPSSHDDSMLASNQRIWGFESNFGGLADLAVVKANQLMPKARHLSWDRQKRRWLPALGRQLRLHRPSRRHRSLRQRRRRRSQNSGVRLGSMLPR